MKMKKGEWNAEQADEKLQVMQWFIVARWGFWRNKNGFIGGGGGRRQWGAGNVTGSGRRTGSIEENGRKKYMHEYRGSGMRWG